MVTTGGEERKTLVCCAEYVNAINHPKDHHVICQWSMRSAAAAAAGLHQCNPQVKILLQTAVFYYSDILNNYSLYQVAHSVERRIKWKQPQQKRDLL